MRLPLRQRLPLLHCGHGHGHHWVLLPNLSNELPLHVHQRLLLRGVHHLALMLRVVADEAVGLHHHLTIWPHHLHPLVDRHPVNVVFRDDSALDLLS